MDSLQATNKQRASDHSSMANSFKASESFSASGEVLIRPFRFNEQGEREYMEDGMFRSNLIVEKGRQSVVELIAGVRRKELTYICWGKGGAPVFPDGDPLLPYNVQDEDTELGEELIEKELTGHTMLSATQVEYIETLISDEVNDDINEAGMFFEDTDTGTRSIFARITFPTVRLLAERGTGIELRWIFNFDRSEELPVNGE